MESQGFGKSKRDAFALVAILRAVFSRLVLSAHTMAPAREVPPPLQEKSRSEKAQRWVAVGGRQSGDAALSFRSSCDFADAVDEELHRRVSTRFFKMRTPIGLLTICNSTGSVIDKRAPLALN